MLNSNHVQYKKLLQLHVGQRIMMLVSQRYDLLAICTGLYITTLLITLNVQQYHHCYLNLARTKKFWKIAEQFTVFITSKELYIYTGYKLWRIIPAEVAMSTKRPSQCFDLTLL